ncbi:hypothetical protein FRC09_008100, partial [Ceratobasidium sp. 395]
MPDNSYRRVIQTTSMTTAERAKSRRIRKAIKRGEQPTEVMTPLAPSNRGGLRPVKYAYTKDGPPKLVVPHEDHAAATTEEVSIPLMS